MKRYIERHETLTEEISIGQLSVFLGVETGSQAYLVGINGGPISLHDGMMLTFVTQKQSKFDYPKEEPAK